jgi:hypothetical protein
MGQGRSTQVSKARPGPPTQAGWGEMLMFSYAMKPDHNQKLTSYPRVPQFPPNPHPQRALFDAPPGRSLN